MSFACTHNQLGRSYDIDLISGLPLTLLLYFHNSGKSLIYTYFTTYILYNLQISINYRNNHQYDWKSTNLFCWMIM